MKPILFNTEQVRNILEGRKTVTRRVIKPQPFYVNSSGRWVWEIPKNKTIPNCCTSVCTASRQWWEYLLESQFPYSVGDILYVRETWAIEECQSCLSGLTHSVEHCQCHYVYKADGDKHIKWRPSIHMPKEAARIFLKVTDVRVERLQDMTHEDCRKEGSVPESWLDEKVEFEMDWNAIYAKRGYSWKSNPWVWVYEFEQMKEGT